MISIAFATLVTLAIASVCVVNVLIGIESKLRRIATALERPE